jgi:signal transduction histidine kinase
VRRRIVTSIVGVTVVALLLLGVPLAFAVQQFYSKEQVLYLHREASEATRNVDAAAIGRDEAITLVDDGDTTLAVYGTDGHKLGGTGPEHGDRPVWSALDGEPGDAHLGGQTVVAITVSQAGRGVGALRAAEPTSVVWTRTLRAWAIMALLAVVVLVVVTLLARRQARRLTRPVDELVGAAERLGGGDFSVRTAPSGIPELDQVGEALDTTAGRLGDLVARERAFTADASHQLRTPVAGLRVGIESALITPGADQRAALEEALRSIDRLETTITDLLRLARDTHADRAPIDVEHVVRRGAEGWEPALRSRARDLQVVIDAGLEQPRTSEPAVRQILEVLVENAIVHGDGVVTVRARDLGGAVAVDVADEGAGVTDPAGVFARRANGSHGIGLPLARSLAEAEGARLVLEHPGPRPVFTVLLPVEPHPPAPGEDAAPATTR